jgi:hypothetical protein
LIIRDRCGVKGNNSYKNALNQIINRISTMVLYIKTFTFHTSMHNIHDDSIGLIYTIFDTINEAGSRVQVRPLVVDQQQQVQVAALQVEVTI